ncbi:C4-dicarboxylic acid transporter DauA [Vibrio stylophorae]|uniref:C4-dicarboxylic acid transporter DauA n=1 Tax=Vibrio stylophorae TaxID=659351 RepID=A0ABM8ZV30_9VIBR|nr:C4-dicarboxylic acid transporter DauA [Vibrio stylophorae]CAH0534192.1 C4-dicarboxylic acid transporter DauA [Vibrio stylophorae]
MVIFSALRDAFRSGYSRSNFKADLVAGITVAIIAIPLAMALAIAVGVPPQYGLYTVIVAGTIAALCGGSRFNITGPTAAFVVILLPITEQYGIQGLLLATVMSGAILFLMGLLKLGRLVMFVPYPVVAGFTAGIGFTIAFLQLKDLLGLTLSSNPHHFLEKVAAYGQALPTLVWADAIVGAVTLAAFVLWRRRKSNIPPHLIALVVGTVTALVLTHTGLGHAATIGDRFSYDLNGVKGVGIPPFLPSWHSPFAGIDMSMVVELLPAAITIALLGSLESLLCAVVADGMTKTKHNPNGELVAQGIANMVTPFFGGIPATAAIARTAANIRAGAISPIAGMVHAAFVLLAIVALAPWLSFIPMSTLAALLVMVAWNMSEVPHFIRTIKVAPKADVAVLLTCFGLTVVFDMVIAVAYAMLLAGVLFIHRMARLTDIEQGQSEEMTPVPYLGDEVSVYKLRGAFFFAACEKVLMKLSHSHHNSQLVVLDMRQLVAMDYTALKQFAMTLEDIAPKPVIILGAAAHIQHKLYKAGIIPSDHCWLCANVAGIRPLIDQISPKVTQALSTENETSMYTDSSSPQPH